MDVLKLLGVVKRRWVIMSLAVLAGVFLAFVTVYRYADGKLKPRAYTQYTMDMQILVVDPAYGMGRAVGDLEAPDTFGKTILLANTYARLATSDEVQKKAEGVAGPSGAAVTAEGVQQAPIINITLEGGDEDRMKAYGVALGKALQAYLVAEQEERKIPKSDRITVRVLSKPSVRQVNSRHWEMALLTFLAPAVVGFSLAVLRDRSLQNRDFFSTKNGGA